MLAKQMVVGCSTVSRTHSADVLLYQLELPVAENN